MNVTNYIHMLLKLSLSLTPIRIKKIQQFFLSGNNFAADMHTKKDNIPYHKLGNKQAMDIDPTNYNKIVSLLLEIHSHLLVQTHFSSTFPSLQLKGHLENEKKIVLTSFLYLSFPEKLSI